MFAQPLAYFAAKFVSGLAEVILRKFDRSLARVAFGEFFAWLPAAAVANDIKMNALEMSGCLVVFGIADRPKRMMRLQGDLPQRHVRIRKRRRSQWAPMVYPQIVMRSGVVERQLHAHEGNQIIGKLVLDRLEPTNRLPKLLSILDVCDGEFECTICGSPGAGGIAKTRDEKHIARANPGNRKADDRRTGEFDTEKAICSHGSGGGQSDFVRFSFSTAA